MVRYFLGIASYVLSRFRGLLFSLVVGRKNVGARLRIGSRVKVRKNTRLIIGDDVTIWDNVIFWGPGEIVLGDRVSIGDNVVFYARKRIEVGEDSMVASFSFITDADHGTRESSRPMNRQPFDIKPVRIGRNVWLGAGCKVLKGSIIGENSVIGANSVVKGEIPSNSVAVGAPARVVKIRRDSE